MPIVVNHAKGTAAFRFDAYLWPGRAQPDPVLNDTGVPQPRLDLAAPLQDPGRDGGIRFHAPRPLFSQPAEYDGVAEGIEMGQLR